MGSGAKCRGPGHNVWVWHEILFAPAHKYFSPMVWSRDTSLRPEVLGSHGPRLGNDLWRGNLPLSRHCVGSPFVNCKPSATLEDCFLSLLYG